MVSIIWSKSNTCVIHIHGKCGNFYSNVFIAVFSEIYGANGIRFLSLNHRGHDCVAENISPAGTVTYQGGSLAMPDSIREDIVTIHEYGRTLSDRVILQGHSQGCEYVLTHALRYAGFHGCILLSPSDSKRIQQKWRDGEGTTAQLARLRHSGLDPDAWADPAEYGVVGVVPYHIPVSVGSLVGVLASEETTAFEFDRPWPHPRLATDCFAYVGGADPLAVHELRIVEEGLARRFEHSTVFNPPDGDHAMRGLEEEVAFRVVQWMAANESSGE